MDRTVMGRLKTCARIAAFVALSPTRLIYEYLKPKATDVTLFARRWPIYFLAAESIVGIVLAAASVERHWQPGSTLAILLGWLAMSRIVEITYAYYSDAIGSLRGITKNTGLTSVDRIQLAMKSYGSLLILWAVLYYMLPKKLFKPMFDTFIDALYFSGETITTLGYGDIVPGSGTAKILCILEVLTGLLVLVVAVGSYLTRSNEPRQSDR